MRSLRFYAVIAAVAAFLPTNAYGQFAGIGAHTRLSDMNNAEANGGNDSTVIGLNANGINNWGINQWDLSSIAGGTVDEVTLSFNVRTNSNANHGSSADTISIHQMYSSNAGWLEGMQVVNANNVETNGGATYNFQSQTSATEGTPWQDANGADVPNLLGAFDPTPIDTVPGHSFDDTPETIEFTIPIAVAQSWVDDPASFAGIVLAANDDGDSLSRFFFPGNPATLTIDLVADVPDVIRGDVNMDDEVNFLDIVPFIAALSNGALIAEADIDQNGMVDFRDITPFIALLSGA